MFHRVKSRNIVSSLLDSDIEEANNANIVDPDDDELTDRYITNYKRHQRALHEGRLD